MQHLSFETSSHPELRELRVHLQRIHDSISHFQPPAKRPPILDSSFDVIRDPTEDTHWLQHDNIPGLKKLRETIKVDLDVLDKFLDDPESDKLPPLSTNAPYLIAVWNEVLCAPAPVVSVFRSFLLSAEDVSKAANESRKRSSAHAPKPVGTKVDVVADYGRRWIRVNTIKNSRILAEFREIDSYLTDDSDSTSDEEDEGYRPSLAQTEFDNSVLRMGKSLIAAARANPLHLPITHTEEIIPRVTLRLTRLDPNGDPGDPRIAQTIQGLLDMGIEVELGERLPTEIPEVPQKDLSFPFNLSFEPTLTVNLDLSVLIALVSDLTHSSLPKSIEEAESRFIPPESYMEWKRKAAASKVKAARKKLSSSTTDETDDLDAVDVGDGLELPLDAQQDLTKHSRALTNQVMQEMGKGLLQELHDRLTTVSSSLDSVEFWTTKEARDRCLRIVSKIGGPNEKRRAQALLFSLDMDAPAPQSLPSATYPDLDVSVAEYESLEKAQAAYWKDSRYTHNFLPFLPMHFFPTSSSKGDSKSISSSLLSSSPFPLPSENFPSLSPPFFFSLQSTCSDILEYEMRARSGITYLKGKAGLEDSAASVSEATGFGDKDQGIYTQTSPRATVTKTNPRLTAHTVQSMLWGSRLGWTTLTANKTSVKAIVKEINARARVEVYENAFGGGIQEVSVASEGRSPNGVPVQCIEEHANESTSGPGSNSKAAIWVIDPRSLAEGMRADFDSMN